MAQNTLQIAGLAYRIAFLFPSYSPYFVPVFEKLYSTIGQGFVVFTQKTQLQPILLRAQNMGSFPKKILAGRQIQLSRRHDDDGCETASGITISPAFISTLIGFRPQVVVSQNFNLWTLTSIMLGYPTVIWWDGTAHTERTVKLPKFKLRCWMAKRAKAFVISGKLAREYVTKELCIIKDNVFSPGICSLIPPKSYAYLKPRTVDQGLPVRFLFVGRLIGRKGLRSLIEAASLLKKRYCTDHAFEVLIVGDGPERADLLNRVEKLGLDEIVHFAGAVECNGVWEYYAQSHVFVMPTLHDQGPIVVNEAMSMGLPLLLSKYAGWMPDLLKEGKNGYCFDPDHPQELAFCMARYLESRQLISTHGAESLRHNAPYTPEHVANVFLSAINEACLRRRWGAGLRGGRAL
jgi:glycosyltransferase involved in cell wall biosynthesis